jgi:hypothetical protein
MSDDFEQGLLADIAEADTFGEDELAAEWRFELDAYRTARAKAIAEGTGWDMSGRHVSRRHLLRRRHPESP